MRKAEFLKELEEALSGEVPAAVMRENLNYYSQYISAECLKGRSEEEVIREIGSPRLIAKTLIDTSDKVGASQGQYYSGDYGVQPELTSAGVMTRNKLAGTSPAQATPLHTLHTLQLPLKFSLATFSTSLKSIIKFLLYNFSINL